MKAIQESLTIFLIGATGDLSSKKILKSLYKLYNDKLLPAQFRLVGNARKEMSNDAFREFAKKAVAPEDEAKWQDFAKTLEYVGGDASNLATFEKLKEFHQNMGSCGNHLWYVATLPKLYLDIVRNIKEVGMNRTDCGWTKFMLEKPFGVDLKTSQELNFELLQAFGEEQIYRIDHFLAKETVQNLLAFRFANGIFEHLWKSQYVDNIQVNAVENLGIAGREVFYDTTGTVRDVLQNHVLQMIATTMMEEPASFSAVDVRAQRQAFLSQLQIYNMEEVKQNIIFAQYEGYKQEKNIPESSKTETAVAGKLFVNNERWRGVPIYFRAGKKMQDTVTEISVQFKEPSNQFLCEAGCPEIGNVLTLRIQPNEGIVLRLRVKKPGLKMALEDAPMQFCYQSEFQMGLVDAYVKLIYDAVQGDIMLFPQADGIEASWKCIQPLIDYKQSPDFHLETYKQGSWGPEAFENLLKHDERQWLAPSPAVCQLPSR